MTQMAGKQPQVVLQTHQLSSDYDDTLEPGYRFRPTDLELVGYYLKRKIELGVHPRCRMYDVHVYDYHPEELKEHYRSCEGEWYFFTKRKPKYPTGTRVDRKTKTLGLWKSTQRENPVYDFVTRRVIGTKRSLTFLDENKKKTPWLMQEYTYIGTHGNKLTDWALCKIYKKDSTRRKDINDETDHQVQNARINLDEASPVKRQRVVPHPEGINQASDTNNQFGANGLMVTMQPYNVVYHDPNQLGFAPEQVQSFYGSCGYYQNQTNYMQTSTSGLRVSSGSTSSSSLGSTSTHQGHPIGDAYNYTYHQDTHTLVNMQNGPMQNADDDIYKELKSFLFDDEGHVHTNFTSSDEVMKSTAHSTRHQDSQTIVNMQSGCNQYMDHDTTDDDFHAELMSLLGDDDNEDV